MIDVQSARQYIVDLYNSYNAIAERVTTERLLDDHVDTPIDDEIQRWVKDDQDVVLTGSPGDGKTHLIEYLRKKNLLQLA